MSDRLSLLEAQGAQLVKELGGLWRNGQGLCLCPAHDDHNPSLSIRVGERALLFKCFAGCDRRDVIRAIRHRHRDVLKGTIGTASAPSVRSGGLPSPLSSLPLIRRLWGRAQPLAGTRAEAYLSRRGLYFCPDALRFLWATPLGPCKAVVFRPAMLAAVREGTDLVAIQRTFFAANRPIRARDLGNPRRMLGRPQAGAVELAPVSDVLGLAEGTETAMSAMVLLGIPVWATLGAERFHRIAIPAGVSRLILLPDNDRAGRAGLTKALAVYRSAGRSIEVILPPAGCKDWNDALRMGEKGGGRIGDGQPEWTGCSARRP
ncbi:DUF7146 domain-containing protein [Novosphingobium sp. KACC 22771]|uniref:DUF7146 domain-containing protein n=1 Tax=Novosphingobium sp. KACC 22771 TaxID=3025670 RepID=UPI0023655D93|nr:toprim domain-containing protein [Novosphingobium sp. KACC 22771]WDF74210.1 toprim domain-containing protein [Novosphingobium sp. KACC 22771]